MSGPVSYTHLDVYKRQVLACVNSPDIGPSFLIDSMAEEAPQLHFERRLDNPPEFADIDPNSDLKVLVFQL